MTDWTKPKKANRADIIIPTEVVGIYLPRMKDIPKGFAKTKACVAAELFCSEWFYTGLKNPEFTTRHDIDEDMAKTQISICLKSYEPKHEHKMLGAAYLATMFFEKEKDNEKVWDFR